jgi:hypothetical protein
MIKRLLLLLLLVLIVIQFIRPSENHSDKQSANDITLHYTVPDTVLSILKRSCYDCHSNNTVYPWYNHIQPVAWWLSSHVKDGKRELNFSEFASYPLKKQARKLKNTVREVKEDGMPLDSYLWIHKDAKLEQGQKDLVIRWADSLQLAILKAGPALTEQNAPHSTEIK